MWKLDDVTFSPGAIGRTVVEVLRIRAALGSCSCASAPRCAWAKPTPCADATASGSSLATKAGVKPQQGEIADIFIISPANDRLSAWRRFVSELGAPKERINIGIVGKYVELEDRPMPWLLNRLCCMVIPPVLPGNGLANGLSHIWERPLGCLNPPEGRIIINTGDYPWC